MEAVTENLQLNYQSSEMGELTAHFVSFLKSLEMRVNAKTLLFFLPFLSNESTKYLDNNGKSKIRLTEAKVMDTTMEDVEWPTDGKASTLPLSASTTPATSNARTHHTEQLPTYLERQKVVEFPLCTSERIMVRVGVTRMKKVVLMVVKIVLAVAAAIVGVAFWSTIRIINERNVEMFPHHRARSKVHHGAPTTQKNQDYQVLGAVASDSTKKCHDCSEKIGFGL